MTRPGIVVSGSRTLTDPAHVIRAFQWAAQRAGFYQLPHMRTVLWVHGDADGVDTILGAHLQSMGCDVGPVPADWDRHGRRAGHIRNGVMVRRAQITGGSLVAVWDGTSRGTAGAIAAAARRRVPTFVEVVHPLPARAPDAEVLL